MCSTLDREAVRLVPQFVDVTLRLAARTLQTGDPQVQRVEALRCLLGNACVMALDAVDAVVHLAVKVLVLLPQVGLELAVARLEGGVVLVHLRVHLPVDLDVPVRRGLELARLRGPGLQAIVDLGVGLVHLALVILLVGIHLIIHLLHLATDLAERLVDFPTAAVHLQPQCRGHVAHCLDRSIDVIVHVVPGSDVGLGIQLCLGLVTQLRNVLGKLMATLVRLLQTLRDVLHPSIMGLKCFLHVAHVQAHCRDLGSHGCFYALPRGDNRVRRVDARPHLIQVDIDGIHGRREVLHVPLARQDDALHVSRVVLRAVEQVLELTNIVFDGIEVMRIAVHACCWAIATRSSAGLRVDEGNLLLDVRGHHLQLA
mmetsp:Transcript_34960/g.88876  ORF Transcript_34960/g.88876 Transcript_34960/m.88876 type:complete len:370 (+) Transcript_34960:1012-2121(+)